MWRTQVAILLGIVGALVVVVGVITIVAPSLFMPDAESVAQGWSILLGGVWCLVVAALLVRRASRGTSRKHVRRISRDGMTVIRSTVDAIELQQEAYSVQCSPVIRGRSRDQLKDEPEEAVRTGDTELDRAMWVSGRAPNMYAVLSPATRASLVEIGGGLGTLILAEDHIELRVPTDTAPKRLSFGDPVDAVMALARALERPTNLQSVLATRAEKDPVMAIRRAAAGALLSDYTDTPEAERVAAALIEETDVALWLTGWCHRARLELREVEAAAQRIWRADAEWLMPVADRAAQAPDSDEADDLAEALCGRCARLDDIPARLQSTLLVLRETLKERVGALSISAVDGVQGGLSLAPGGGQVSVVGSEDD